MLKQNINNICSATSEMVSEFPKKLSNYLSENNNKLNEIKTEGKSLNAN